MAGERRLDLSKEGKPERAVHLLKTTNLSIKTIALRVGLNKQTVSNLNRSSGARRGEEYPGSHSKDRFWDEC